MWRWVRRVCSSSTRNVARAVSNCVSRAACSGPGGKTHGGGKGPHQDCRWRVEAGCPCLRRCGKRPRDRNAVSCGRRASSSGRGNVDEGCVHVVPQKTGQGTGGSRPIRCRWDRAIAPQVGDGITVQGGLNGSWFRQRDHLVGGGNQICSWTGSTLFACSEPEVERVSIAVLTATAFSRSDCRSVVPFPTDLFSAHNPVWLTPYSACSSVKPSNFSWVMRPDRENAVKSR